MYVEFDMEEAKMAKPFQQAQICEDRSLRTGILDEQKTADNIDDSIGLRSKT
jgi:hypothetical protein